VLASASSLLDITIRASSAFHKIYKELKDGPALILALSNETADLTIVLNQVGRAKKTLERLDPHENAAVVTALGARLGRAKEILENLDTFATDLLRQKRSTQRIQWCLKKGKATTLKDDVREVRMKLNELLTAHNT
jgi:hypothetical protein